MRASFGHKCFLIVRIWQSLPALGSTVQSCYEYFQGIDFFLWSSRLPIIILTVKLKHIGRASGDFTGTDDQYIASCLAFFNTRTNQSSFVRLFLLKINRQIYIYILIYIYVCVYLFIYLFICFNYLSTWSSIMMLQGVYGMVNVNDENFHNVLHNTFYLHQ